MNNQDAVTGLVFDTSELERQCSAFASLLKAAEPILEQDVFHQSVCDLTALVHNVLLCDRAPTLDTDGTKKLRVGLRLDGRFELLRAAIGAGERNFHLHPPVI
jgi:hypothetical protein